MPMTSAARRASRASSSVQQPRAPVRYELGLLDSARWTPVTSCPASAARAAATAESTPPDMAASTRRKVIVYRGYASQDRLRASRAGPPGDGPAGGGSPGRAAGARHHLLDHGADSVHVLLRGCVTEREPQ